MILGSALTTLNSPWSKKKFQPIIFQEIIITLIAKEVLIICFQPKDFILLNKAQEERNKSFRSLCLTRMS